MAAKFKYLGEDVRDLAGVGEIYPGAVFSVTNEQAQALQKNAPETYELVDDATKLTTGKKPVEGKAEAKAEPAEKPAKA